jgi:hypothetical protein
MTNTQAAIEKLLKESPPEVRAAVVQIIKIEQEHLYMAKPQGLPAQIVDAVEGLVK